jgi:hypothetical protein
MAKQSLLKLFEEGENVLATPNAPDSPATPDFQVSTLHNEYSLDGDPSALAVKPKNGTLPEPTTLRLPESTPRYLDNPPEVASTDSAGGGY